MLASIERGVISISALFIVFQCVSPSRQYFKGRWFGPSYDGTEENASVNSNSDDATDNRYVNFWDFQDFREDDFIPDGRFTADTTTTENSFWSTEGFKPLPPIIYSENQFNSGISDPETQQKEILYDEFPSQFQRGRSDIEPEEDEEEFGGYFYPKPKIPFNLPDFKTVGVAADTQPDTTIITTTKPEEPSTENTSTATLSTRSSTGSTNKVQPEPETDVTP